VSWDDEVIPARFGEEVEVEEDLPLPDEPPKEEKMPPKMKKRWRL
jgi:hypothetical protein